MKTYKVVIKKTKLDHIEVVLVANNKIHAKKYVKWLYNLNKVTMQVTLTKEHPIIIADNNYY